jgi:hypothetical protein
LAFVGRSQEVGKTDSVFDSPIASAICEPISAATPNAKR